MPRTDARRSLAGGCPPSGPTVIAFQPIRPIWLLIIRQNRPGAIDFGQADFGRRRLLMVTGGVRMVRSREEARRFAVWPAGRKFPIVQIGYRGSPYLAAMLSLPGQ